MFPFESAWTKEYQVTPGISQKLEAKLSLQTDKHTDRHPGRQTDKWTDVKSVCLLSFDMTWKRTTKMWYNVVEDNFHFIYCTQVIISQGNVIWYITVKKQWFINPFHVTSEWHHKKVTSTYIPHCCEPKALFRLVLLLANLCPNFNCKTCMSDFEDYSANLKWSWKCLVM